MLLPQPQLMNEPHFSIRGDVTVHPSAAIAPGVILHADLSASLVIGAGVSIAAGSVLHAHEGTLVIEANVCLGSGVLLVGSGKIGANACIGSMTTIFNGCVEAGQVVPAGSLIGDRSRQILLAGSDSTSDTSDFSQNSFNEGNKSEATGAASPVGAILPEAIQSEATQPEAVQPETEETQSQSAQPNVAQEPKVYGLDAFNGLMASLFPHRQSLNQPLNQTTSALDQASE